MADKNIFERIIDGEIPAKKVYEDELCLAFHDVKPQAPVHVLVIPKQRIESVDDLSPAHAALIGHLWVKMPQIAAMLGLEQGYRVVVNCGANGGQEVPHLHFHLLGGRKLSWPPG